MRQWIVTIKESTRVQAIVLAKNRKEACLKVGRGDYDKMLNTAIPISDDIESIKEGGNVTLGQLKETENA